MLKYNFVLVSVCRVLSGGIGVLSSFILAKILGPNNFGMYSFTLLIVGIVSLLDFGTSAYVNQIVASSINRYDENDRLHLFLSEMYSWFACGVVGLCLFFCGDLLSSAWLLSTKVLSQNIRSTIALAGAIAGLQLPALFYSAVLNGAEKHAHLNISTFIFAIFKYTGSILVAWKHGSLENVLIWQVALQILAVYYLKYVCPKFVMENGEHRLSLEKIRLYGKCLKKYACLNSIKSIGANIDKLIIARFCPIETLGVYNILVTSTTPINMIPATIYSVLFPKLCQAKSQSDINSFHNLLAIGNAVVYTIVTPVTGFLIFFNRHLIDYIFKDASSIQHSPYLIIIPISALINSITFIANNLSWVGFMVSKFVGIYIASVVVLSVMLLGLAERFGILGVSIAVLISVLVQSSGTFLISKKIAKWPSSIPKLYSWYTGGVALSILGAYSINWAIPACSRLNIYFFGIISFAGGFFAFALYSLIGDIFGYRTRILVPGFVMASSLTKRMFYMLRPN